MPPLVSCILAALLGLVLGLTVFGAVFAGLL